MTKKLQSMLNETEQALVREVEPKRLGKLDEDELIELHTRVRRARNKYTKLYRQRAAKQVGSACSPSGPISWLRSPAHQDASCGVASIGGRWSNARPT